ncbi:MAG: hypothetical protein ACI9H6_000521, partial [Patiriisocius sp.]
MLHVTLARLLLLKGGAYATFRLAQNDWDPAKTAPVIAKDMQNLAKKAGDSTKKGADYIVTQARLLMTLQKIKESKDSVEIANAFSSIVCRDDSKEIPSNTLENIAKTKALEVATTILGNIVNDDDPRVAVEKIYTALYLIGSVGEQLPPEDVQSLLSLLISLHITIEKDSSTAKRLQAFDSANPVILMGALAEEEAIKKLRSKDDDPLCSC